MTPKRKRLFILLLCSVSVCAGAAVILYSFSQNLVYFYTPSQLDEHQVQVGQKIRLGGLVKVGTLKRDGTTVRFAVTDLTEELNVRYEGTLPNLFKEGQGVIAEGKLTESGQLIASAILAKHDENYMPPEVADALKKSGKWQHYSPENVEAYSP